VRDEHILYSRWHQINLKPCYALQAHIHVFLIKFGNDHILVDVGAPEQEYEWILLNGLDKTLGSNGKLRLLLLTHGHIDHIGAIKALVAMYPDIQVAFHKDEAPYVTGGQHALMSHCMISGSSYQHSPGA